MGELADRIRKLVDDVDDWPTPTWEHEFAALAGRVAELEARDTVVHTYELAINRLCNIAEQWIDRYEGRYPNDSPADVAASSARIRAHLADMRRAVLVPTELAESVQLVRDFNAKPMLSDRLADAEQRAAAAWAAVTELLERDEACVGVHHGAPSVLEYVDNNGHPYHSKLLGYAPRHCVTIVYAVNAPANPDLLERASVELAEAYQRAKAEEQRQAEEKAAVAT